MTESQDTEVEIEVRVDERTAQRFRLVEQVSGLSAEEVARRYLEYGALHHEEAIFS